MVIGATDDVQLGGAGAGRVLVFTVDDGLFSLQLDWIEAVYPRDAVEVHVVRTRGGRPQPFLSHRDQPALILDLRELVGLSGVLGETERSSFLVVRCGSHLVALQADACVGVRELDLGKQVPVESALIRDSGLCVGHLVEQDGGMLAVLDPNQLVDGAMRESLAPALREAAAFIDRQQKVDGLWRELCDTPTPLAVRTYSRLCKRVGRPKAANAAKTILKYLEGPTAAAGDSAADRLMRELVRLGVEKSTGELVLESGNGKAEGKFFLVAGRTIDAYYQSDWGRRAVRKMLELREGNWRFVESSGGARPVRMAESTVALVISALESISEDRRGRRER